MIDSVYESKVSEKVIREKMEKSLVTSKKQIAIYRELLKHLQQFDGKKVTKRIQTYLNGVDFFKDYTVMLRSPYSWTEISINHNSCTEISTKHICNVILFYNHETDILSVERVKELNPSLEIGVVESIKATERHLNNLSITVEKYNKIMKDVDGFKKEFEDILWFFRKG